MTVGMHIYKILAVDGRKGGYEPDFYDMDYKALRRVRTPAGAARYKVPIGSVIIGNGVKLNNITLMDSEYEGFDKVKTKKGKTLYVGKFPDEDVFVVTDENDKVLFEADTLDGAFAKADGTGTANGRPARKRPGTAGGPKLSDDPKERARQRRNLTASGDRRMRNVKKEQEKYGHTTQRYREAYDKQISRITKLAEIHKSARDGKTWRQRLADDGILRRYQIDMDQSIGVTETMSNEERAKRMRNNRTPQTRAQVDAGGVGNAKPKITPTKPKTVRGKKESNVMADLDYKAVPVSSISEAPVDEGKGVVTALVAVTGIKDNVNDIIMPGAFEKSLLARKAKGVWHHDVTSSVSKTVEIKELRPGDSLLPETLPNGEPWPEEAGGLWVKMQFNLNTHRGREAYEDVKFFGADQEWSIGYNVPMGGAITDKKSGVRSIHTLNLYEYSPVLFGAMPNARTLMDVKSAQHTWKTLCSTDNLEIKSLFEELMEEQKAAKTKADMEEEEDEDNEEETPESEDDEEEDDEDEEKSALETFIKGMDFKDVDHIDRAIKELTEVRDAALKEWSGDIDDDDFPDWKDYVSDLEVKDDLVSLCKDAGLAVETEAAAFDTALTDGDEAAMEESAEAVLDAVEAALDDADDDQKESLRAVTGKISGAFQDSEAEAGDEEETEEEEKGETVVIDTKSFLAALD